MTLHFMIVLWLSVIFLVSGIASLIAYKVRGSKEAKESLLGLTVILIVFGVVGILFVLIFGH
ncbi:hypothetical protein NQ035_10325 [Staphylococcus gallinarum]|uniref:type II toxin-antitoxin system toxin TsaT n=1 Tax=Staphylococcus TaxID=1279 RepID=UPI000E6891B7|nr:hypothetical protein [Staphylococcus gallinarum]MCD8825266.1 hypothetical protein [Staphylococcus gallinarum]MCD8872172.1 hypothetical protein [Staphylococcus gallinarum]MCQ9289265.1 hypothetical protein [Staphylococcus gallinarum]MCW0984404.1 hypothetical protein [Staphylococcus gallinarum]MEB6242371.1 hypothetical protein [Staphylococcus gallinarum]